MELSDSHSDIQNKIKRKNRLENKIFLIGYLSLFSFFAILFVIKQYLQTYNLINYIYFVYIIPGFFLLRWAYHLNKISVLPKEVLFYRLYNVFTGLKDLKNDTANNQKLKRVTNSMYRTKSAISNFLNITFLGFEYDRKIEEFLKILSKNLEKYQDELENKQLSQDLISKQIGIFEKLLINIYKENFDEIVNILKPDYREEENRISIIFEKIISVISIKEILKYVISLTFVVVLSTIMIVSLTIPIGQDLASIITLVVTGAALITGIKKYIIDNIEKILKREDSSA